VDYRAAVFLAGWSVPLALLAGCSASDVTGGNSEAFTVPLSHNLIADPPTGCDGGQLEAGDTLTVSGFDYLPGAVVTLRWTVLSASETGTLATTTADRDGEFEVPLKITRSIADPGDEITITSQGAGETGVMMLETKFVMGTC